jgi:biopolymer transport protein TolR
MEIRRATDREPLSAINITPLVDVMLVLLIIFMVTASIGQQGITVHLPQAKAPALPTSGQTIIISIDANKTMYINSTPVAMSDLAKRLRTIYQARSNKTAYLKSDKAVSYGDFIRVVALIKSAGVEQLGMETEGPRQ